MTADELTINIAGVETAKEIFSALVEIQPEKSMSFVLTEEGIIKAQELLRKHRILETLFVRFLNYPSRTACEEAAELDHHVSDKLANAICQAYGHPEVCPCNKPIFTNIECRKTEI